MPQCNKTAIAMQQRRCRLQLRILFRRIEVKKTTLSIAAAALISMAAATTCFAAELPSYETTGLPISAVQGQGLGAAEVREHSASPTPSAPPVPLTAPTPR